MHLVSQSTRVVLAFFVIYVVWGTTFFAVHLALKSFPPFLLAGLRLLIAGTALSIFCIARGESFPPKQEIIKHVTCGIIVFIGGIVAVVWAQQFISSSLASIVVTTPFWFVVLDKKQWNFYFSSPWIPMGLLLGLLGVVLLMAFNPGRAGTGSDIMQALAIAVIVIGSLMWAAVSLYLRYEASKISVYVSTSLQLLGAGALTLLISYLTGEFSIMNWADVRADASISILYLSIVSSLIGFLSYIWLIKVHPPAIVGTYAYVNPLVATLLGWAFAGEDISYLQMLALGLILLGVFLVNIPKYFKRTLVAGV